MSERAGFDKFLNEQVLGKNEMTSMFTYAKET